MTGALCREVNLDNKSILCSFARNTRQRAELVFRLKAGKKQINELKIVIYSVNDDK